MDYATHAFQGAATAAGIHDIRQHDTRHAFAIRRLRGGANLVAVSGLLRHASTRMSERYLHVTRADLRAAVEAGQSPGVRSPHPPRVDTSRNSDDNAPACQADCNPSPEHTHGGMGEVS